jgi:hypothetical protein
LQIAVIGQHFISSVLTFNTVFGSNAFCRVPFAGLLCLFIIYRFSPRYLVDFFGDDFQDHAQPSTALLHRMVSATHARIIQIDDLSIGASSKSFALAPAQPLPMQKSP